MELNKYKSGIIHFQYKDRQDDPPDLEGIPLAKRYKYLGTILNEDLDLEDHLSTLTRKISFIRLQLYGIRKLSKIHLNLNLFKLLITPLYRMAFSLFLTASFQHKQKFIAHFKSQLKKFLCLPRNTADATVFHLFGDIQTYIHTHALVISQRSLNSRGAVLAIKKPVVPKHFPPKTTKLIQVMYGAKCGTHKVIMNEEHMEAHDLESLRTILMKFKEADRKLRKKLSNKCNKLIKKVESVINGNENDSDNDSE